ncbi:MAG TPA: D-cysteine desulfhydrase family protein [Acidimicrobiales bacterium]|nr:D-cysteine desulfhydrase family protein [Acidimicrobiales bacterium]
MTAPKPARRVPLAHLPTPLEPADRLGAALGLGPGTLWVKRDDCTGLAGGGNKARKLEYLCGEALQQGCDTLVTGGGRQSNHVRMTAAAANRLGLACAVVLAGDAAARPTGNVVLDHLLGAELVWGGDLDYYGTEAAIVAESERLRAEGRRPYAMPVGGASVTGELAYVEGARELEAQLRDAAGPDAAGRAVVVVADGSGGTHAGLVAGLGDHGRVLGVDVGTRPDLSEQVPAKAAEVAAAAGLRPPLGTCRLDRERFGDGYGAPTPGCREALDLAARLEGLVLDPVYTGKAMAGLVAAVREGGLGADVPVVFLHTGGMPALFASRYAAWIAERP